MEVFNHAIYHVAKPSDFEMDYVINLLKAIMKVEDQIKAFNVYFLYLPLTDRVVYICLPRVYTLAKLKEVTQKLKSPYMDFVINNTEKERLFYILKHWKTWRSRKKIEIIGIPNNLKRYDTISVI